jgi:putative transposase
MTNYRRNLVPGGAFFFTVNLADRRLRLLTENTATLRWAFRRVRARHPVTIEAAVVLPDHLHTIWTLPAGDADFATRWRLIKSGFARALPAGERISTSRAAKGERGIWQRRYWEHTLRDDDDFARHLDYIHFNPVKHGHWLGCGIGPIPPFAAGSGSASIPKTGRTPPMIKSPHSARGDVFRPAQPILRAATPGPVKRTARIGCYRINTAASASSQDPGATPRGRHRPPPLCVLSAKALSGSLPASMGLVAPIDFLASGRSTLVTGCP